MQSKWQEFGEKGDWQGFNRELVRVIEDSSSPDEVKRRLREELGFPPVTDNTFRCEVTDESRGITQMKDGRWLRYAYRAFDGSPITPMDTGM